MTNYKRDRRIRKRLVCWIVVTVAALMIGSSLTKGVYRDRFDMIHATSVQRRRLTTLDPKSVQQKPQTNPLLTLPGSFHCNHHQFGIPAKEISRVCSNSQPASSSLPMAAIVQVFNHASYAGQVLQSLDSQPNVPLVLVYEDGSTDGSYEAYQAAAAKLSTKIQVTQADNLHEIRNYNRGIRHILDAPGLQHVELFALMQDDDILASPNDNWAQRASHLFQAMPHLCVLGGYVGWDHVHGGALQSPEWFSNEPSYNKKKIQIPVSRKCLGQTFRYVGLVASSPMILRRSCVQELGLLDEMTTKSGDPGIMFDVEYSLRAWLSGNWSVGLYRTEYTHGVGGHGTLSSPQSRQKRRHAGEEARAYIRGKFGNKFDCEYNE